MSQIRPSSDEILFKCRKLYSQVQNDLNNLHRISEDRMKKRYLYIDKQIKIRQKNQQKNNLDQMKFYRNKFHTLMTLVNESIRQSYSKNKFENQVKNVLKQNWDHNQLINSKNNQLINSKTFQKTNSIQQKLKQQQKIHGKNQNQLIKPKPVQFTEPIQKQVKQIKNTEKSLSPLQKFFQNNSTIKKVNFLSVIPKSQIQNSKILQDIKKMPKKKQSNVIKNLSTTKQDSRIRDLKRQNEQLQKIYKKKVLKDQNPNNLTVQQLQKEIYYFKKVNQQLKQKNSFNNKSQQNYSCHPYQIPYRRNNVSEIEYRNLEINTQKLKQEQLKRSNKSPTSKSYIQKRIFKDQIMTEDNSAVSMNSTKIQRQKQVYINSTPQVLFQNQLIKVMIIRNPIKIEQKLLKSVSYENLNPQDVNPNEQKLQLIILNNGKQNIVNSTQIFVKTDYNYDRKLHKLSGYKKSTKEYSKKISNYKDIVYCEIVRIKLLDKQGYNEQIKVKIKAEFFYNSQIYKKKNRMEQIIGKKQDQVEIQVKIPVTFIQFSNRPFSGKPCNSTMSKLSIIPNPLYDTFQHTYINTKLPIKKQLNPLKPTKQTCIIYGRSFIHGSSSSTQGIYLQSEIQLAWSQKKEIKYLSISTIQQWVYLISYIFMDIKQEQEQFENEFRKPSMHVFFNLEDKKIV